jgi:hypothetical protein
MDKATRRGDVVARIVSRIVEDDAPKNVLQALG